jgi:hypothetical protein
MASAQPIDASKRHGVLNDFDELLRQPLAGLARAQAGGPSRPYWRLLGGSTVCCLLYGAVSGSFQGGTQIVLAALKAGFIVGGSVALCLPSLYVLASLLGANLSGARLLAVVAGFSGMLAALLAGLLPIAWLFSVSSATVRFVFCLHAVLWSVAVFFAGRYLNQALRDAGARSPSLLWLVLFCVVSFQMTTLVRPVLWRAPGAPVVETGRMFFLEHLRSVMQLATQRTPEPATP